MDCKGMRHDVDPRKQRQRETKARRRPRQQRQRKTKVVSYLRRWYQAKTTSGPAQLAWPVAASRAERRQSWKSDQRGEMQVAFDSARRGRGGGRG